jgi:hypothetical protein
MAKECAFCPFAGKLTAEHIASQWMRDLFPGRKSAFFIGETAAGKKNQRFETSSMHWTAKVVCEQCNVGWMSKIEDEHAMPALTPLITGQFDIPIDRARAHSISLFAFKTAVIIDHQQKRDTGPFFSKRVRYAFRIHHAIPNNVAMWFCGYKGNRGGVQFKSTYAKGDFPRGHSFYTYVCTCALGHFAFQVVSVKQIGTLQFGPSGGFEDLAVPFFPVVPRDYVWPSSSRYVLGGPGQFMAFASRWNRVNIIAT